MSTRQRIVVVAVTVIAFAVGVIFAPALRGVTLALWPF
jgi:hypothetical protein